MKPVAIFIVSVILTFVCTISLLTWSAAIFIACFWSMLLACSCSTSTTNDVLEEEWNREWRGFP